jgi:hypothetical protein
MIANFFRSLEAHRVAYLLISGQATVLYGASVFSEDIDLWLEPTNENIERFVSVLRESQARYYKLTPRLNVENLGRGHGFHFIVPDERGEAFLDIMGKPPRVGEFAKSFQKARWMESEWGRLPTVGLKDLVEIKKTQRIGDYPIVSKLAVKWFDQPECVPSPVEWEWACSNIFTSDHLRELFERQPAAIAAAPRLPPALHAFAGALVAGDEVPVEIEDGISNLLQEQIQSLQRADRQYWRPIIDDLRKMRAQGELMPEDEPV